MNLSVFFKMYLFINLFWGGEGGGSGFEGYSVNGNMQVGK